MASRAVYVLAAAIFVHALALYFGPGRYSMDSSGVVIDTRTRALWALSRGSPDNMFRGYELRPLMPDVAQQPQTPGMFAIGLPELLVVLGLWGVPIALGVRWARSRQRRGWIWGLICLGLGPLGLIVLGVVPDPSPVSVPSERGE